jgi:hypothetical protein
LDDRLTLFGYFALLPCAVGAVFAQLLGSPIYLHRHELVGFISATLANWHGQLLPQLIEPERPQRAVRARANAKRDIMR